MHKFLRELVHAPGVSCRRGIFSALSLKPDLRALRAGFGFPRQLHSPATTMPPTAQESFGNFDLIQRTKLNLADIVVSKWRSRVSGLSVVHLDYEGTQFHFVFFSRLISLQLLSSRVILLLAPRVRLLFDFMWTAIYTLLVFDDSGCPHTLEQYVPRCLNWTRILTFSSLVFMGSEKYPYKGIIDHFANRGFSSGTNAWTDTDHTAYTVATAGDQGFLQLLPIFVDHILYPTMTDAGFVTEVRALPLLSAFADISS